MTENGHEVEKSGTAGDRRHDSSSPWRMAGWVVFGIALGLVLAVAFIAYGQPELLLEQMNLRYCG